MISRLYNFASRYVVVIGDWLLLGGFWSDAGAWDDNSNWID